MGQSSQRNEVSVSGGVLPADQPNQFETATAVGLGATYSYRAWRFVHLDAGLFVALSPTPEIRGAHIDIHPGDRFYWATFGPRVVLPMKNDRFEFSLGAGVMHENYDPGSDFLATSRSGWGGYFTGGPSVALDHGRHVWLGFKPRFFIANTSAFEHDRWLLLAGELGYRF